MVMTLSALSSEMLSIPTGQGTGPPDMVKIQNLMSSTEVDLKSAIHKLNLITGKTDMHIKDPKHLTVLAGVPVYVEIT